MIIKNKNILINILKSELGQYKLLNNDESEWYCPFCHHHKKKLKINLHNGNWHCFVCEARSQNIIDLFKKIQSSHIKDIIKIVDISLTYIPNYNKADEIICKLPGEFKPLSIYSKYDIEYKHALQYLYKRNIFMNKIDMYNIGYCNEGIYKHYIIVPSYNKEGKLNYFVARNYYNNNMKYKNPKISKNVTLFEQYISWKFPVILVEGVFDAIAANTNAIPLLGKTINDSIIENLVKNNVDRIYLALDEDAISNIYKNVMKLKKYNIESNIVFLPKEKDPSDLGESAFMDLVSNSKQINTMLLSRLKYLSYKH